MIKKQHVLFCIFLIIFGFVFHFQFLINGRQKIENSSIQPASLNDYELFEPQLLNDIFISKKNNFTTLGYFPELYEPSLHSTYYALYILNAIGKLNQIDIYKVSDYIMSFYEESSYIFIDRYTERYLDMDTSMIYYPYTSLLQINCYAVLSLDILSTLHFINKESMINFIWSCYNPDTSGFIGQPFSADLSGLFNVSTADNTYYATLTLDILMNNWDDYSSEKSDIIQYLNSLQSTNNKPNYFGGFYNDLDGGISTLGNAEPNMLSSYYCIKALQLFDLVGTIRLNDFYQFLENVYNSEKDYFYYRNFTIPLNYSNIVASSLGLELSDITGFTDFRRTKVINFIINKRNTYGVWDLSTTQKYHELLYTFQVIRSLSNSGELLVLTQKDFITIANTVNDLYQSYHSGFSILSHDYSSLRHIYSVINAFDMYNQVSELRISELYDLIKSCIIDDEIHSDNFLGFAPTINMDQYSLGFNTFPIEYFNYGNTVKTAEYLISHKTLYFALDSLKKLYKLDDFKTEYDLQKIVEEILTSQFLELGKEGYGGFLPNYLFRSCSIEFQKRWVFMEYSYYAIRVLKLLAKQLDIENIGNMGVDTNALKIYLLSIIETTPLSETPHYEDAVEFILENTYYIAYSLKAVDYNEFNVEEVKSFILNNLDYSNILNLYHSFKLNSLLDLGINFNVRESQTLFHQVYSQTLQEFYVSVSKEKIEHMTLSYVCEMLQYLPITIDRKVYEENILSTSFPLALICIIVPGSLIVISKKQLNKLKEKHDLK